jgi:hypothetical protein
MKPYVKLHVTLAITQIPPITALVVGSQRQVKEFGFQTKVRGQSQVLLVTVPRA